MDIATEQPPAAPEDWAEAQPLLRPVLRPQSYVNYLVNAGGQPWVRPVFPFINEMVVVDLPTVRAMVTPAETSAWGITGDEAFAVARENLSARQQTFAPGEKFLLKDADGGTYIESMILATGWLGSLAVAGGPRPLVFFPGDGVLLLGTDAPDDAANLFEVAEQMYLDAEQPISPQGYTIEGTVIAPFDQAGPHPLRELALRARTLLATQEYRHQTEFLREHYERELFPQYVGEAQVIETAWGRRTTVAWGQGIPWELPQTDYVTFLVGDPSNVSDKFTVPFATVVDAVGILPVAGISPVRYRANEWPTPELLATLKAHAVDFPSE
ncbi:MULTISPECIES: hypothetical protein [Mycobacterium]|uniref:Uncharacterized protein n=1 Tax=Mycobacterium colombiense TaxID=339268 RepID=A0A329M9N3_9MYCO|nr:MULTISPECIES: hypothetical protein [Mycobacterium]MDM4139356.1 hypothetical protein [Mycobacterium sp. FLAC0960]RAV16570.1 hypothetical protein DQP57_02685 [Mycobacterium colombiense]